MDELHPIFETAAETLLGYSFSEGATHPSQSVLMWEDGLHPFEIGARGGELADLRYALTDVRERPADPADPEADQGVWFGWRTQALDRAPIVTPPRFSFHVPAVSTPFGSESHAFWPSDPEPVDVNTLLTTGTLNQVLRVAAGSSLLNFWSEPIPSAELEAGIPELATYGVPTWNLHITMGQGPTGAVPPTITMTRNVGLDAETVHFELPQIKVEIVHPGSGDTVAELQVDLHSLDPAFFFGDQDGRLQTDLDLQTVNARVMRHQLSAWPDETLLLAAVTPTLAYELFPRLQTAITDIAMPEYATLPRVSSPTLSFQEVGDPWIRYDTFGLFHQYDAP
jgi:hypothetical protein